MNKVLQFNKKRLIQKAAIARPTTLVIKFNPTQIPPNFSCHVSLNFIHIPFHNPTDLTNDMAWLLELIVCETGDLVLQFIVIDLCLEARAYPTAFILRVTPQRVFAIAWSRDGVVDFDAVVDDGELARLVAVGVCSRH